MSPRREAGDTSEPIRRAVEENQADRGEVSRFRIRAAIAIAVLAMLLALASLGGENSENEMINNNIYASNLWDLHQVKDNRQVNYEVAADRLEIEMELRGASLTPETRQHIQNTIDRYRAAAALLESQPDPADPDSPLRGEGKRELAIQAQRYEAARDRAQAQDPNFDYSSALLQIAIVLGSVSIVVVSPRILMLGLALGAVATLLMLNGFFLLAPLSH